MDVDIRTQIWLKVMAPTYDFKMKTWFFGMNDWITCMRHSEDLRHKRVHMEGFFQGTFMLSLPLQSPLG